ncbi:metacaspase-9 [Tripterygium wilfordii]|uniref:Metacaspase-9 n=1 Tax=Tripterygium wilfordii TaxID=458696 RepID=A0A7J7DVL4_TRIWF|nr:metacaspase-9 [Tripterygium wilfordii]
MQHLRDIHDIPHDDTHHIGNLLVHVFGEHVSEKFTLARQELDSKIQQLKIDEGILLSGCQADEFSHEYHTNDGSCVGAFSYAVQMVLQDDPSPLTNREVVTNARIKIRAEGYFDQHPCLYSNDENADAFFLHQ